MTVRIKFCGITRAEDARTAVALGVDAVGFVFTRRSQRYVGVAQARAMRDALPPFTSVVALFMDDEPAWVEDVIAGVRPDLLQFHGSESAGYATSFARPYLMAIPMAGADARSIMEAHPQAAGFLLDSHAPGAAGGSGQPFDWSHVPKSTRPVILAGGLDAGNVAQAIAVVRPYAVDVSSGIEAAPGIKDAARMRAFVASVRGIHAQD
ncbi:MAG TPA: phosphoribosylanthranilate isomerase [Dokdonella sp.]